MIWTDNYIYIGQNQCVFILEECYALIQELSDDEEDEAQLERVEESSSGSSDGETSEYSDVEDSQTNTSSQNER